MGKLVAIILSAALAACVREGVRGETSGPLIDDRVMADVARSEWAPPGVVSLNLHSGRYLLTPAPARGASVRPPSRRGRLTPAELAPIRAAFASARMQGLVDSACGNGGRPAQIVVSNAGPPALVLTTGEGAVSAPSELGCWSDAARSLLRVLEERFQAAARSPR